MTKVAQSIGLIVSILLCLGAGGLGAIVTTPEIDGWYKSLAKPTWNPPDYVFGPMWTTLYILMAISAWLIWRRAGFNSVRILRQLRTADRTGIDQRAFCPDRLTGSP